MSSNKEGHLFTQRQKKAIALAGVIAFLLLGLVIAHMDGCLLSV